MDRLTDEVMEEFPLAIMFADATIRLQQIEVEKPEDMMNLV